MTPSPILRKLAASTAVALAFSPLAQAEGLIDHAGALHNFLSNISNELTRVSGSDTARLRAGGFAQELEAALQSPSDKTRIVDYPKPAVVERLRVTAVVPPKGFEALPIPVCAEQNNKVLGIWNITAKGEVVPAPWTGARESEGNSAACKSFIVAARDDINQKLAQNPPGGNTPAQPPPGVSGKVASAVPVPLPRPGMAAVVVN